MGVIQERRITELIGWVASKFRGNLGFSVRRMRLCCSKNWDYWKSVSVCVCPCAQNHQAICLSLFSPHLSIRFWPLFTSRRCQLQTPQHYLAPGVLCTNKVSFYLMQWCILKMWSEQHRRQYLISCYHSAACLSLCTCFYLRSCLARMWHLLLKTEIVSFPHPLYQPANIFFTKAALNCGWIAWSGLKLVFAL